MSVKSDESINTLGDDRVQKMFRALHQRLNISVDFNSPEPGGAQFWSQLESDLVRVLEIDSIDDVESAARNLSLILGKLLKEEHLSFSEPELDDLLSQLVDQYFGLGVLDILLRDDSIYEIFVNNFQEIYFGRKGEMQRAPFSFLNEAHLQHVVDRLCARNNTSLPSGENPITKFTLSDNSSVIILFPPVTPNSPSVSIRRVVRKPITIDQLVKWGSVSADMLQFLKASVDARLNILVCGYLGSGADTIVNVLSSFVPGNERVISIEYESNYSLRINHLIKLIAQNDLMGENSFIKLLALAGKLGGDRLFLGEFLFSDAYNALTSVSDDFSGSILRVVAKSPADAVNRLETFIQLDKPNLPRAKIGNLICSSIDLIVYQERLSDGTRVIKKIVEVLDEPNHGGQVLLRELYGVERTGFQDGRILRMFKSYGPPSDRLMEKINVAGINLPSNIFVPGEDTKHDTKLTETERRAIKFSKGKYAFVSYSREDRDHVRALASELENKGFDVWLDVLNINPGEEWTKVLENAIKNAGAFLVILTPSAVQSQFVRNEIIMAQDEKLPIIPVKMDECDTPIQIRALQYILYDKQDMTATVNLISESLSRYISNKQLLGNM